MNLVLSTPGIESAEPAVRLETALPNVRPGNQEERKRTLGSDRKATAFRKSS